MDLPQNDSITISAISANDANFIFELVNSATWIKYIGDKNIKTEEDVLMYIDSLRFKMMVPYPLGYLKIENKNGESLGIMGILQREYLELPDIGFALLQKHEGKGIAESALKIFLPWYKSKFPNFNQIGAIVQPNNTKSIRLLEKLKFSFSKSILHENETLHFYVSDIIL